MIERTVKTPCIGVCSTGIGDRVCRGCKRFAHEVIHWNSYSNEQKQLIEERLSQFLSQDLRNELNRKTSLARLLVSVAFVNWNDCKLFGCDRPTLKKSD